MYVLFCVINKQGQNRLLILHCTNQASKLLSGYHESAFVPKAEKINNDLHEIKQTD